MRAQVFARDRGICSNCKVDAVAWRRRLRALPPQDRAVVLAADGIKESQLQKSLWEADHILPVSQGGGCCGLENLRTLCIRCHRIETSKLRNS